MIKTILGWVLVGVVFAVLLLLFINGGGYRSIVNTAHSIPSLKDYILGTASSSQFQLPGQDSAFQNLGVDVDTGSGGNDTSVTTNTSYTTPPPSGISQPTQVQEYGDPSPYAGKVSLSATNVYATDPSQEYVTLQASDSNTALVDISGWYLQSMVSGVKLYIPLAASPYVLGVVNRVSDALLAPGGSAIVVSGVSPVGVSFRETLCTGYLNQTQSFAPALSNSCPTRDQVMPETADNIARFGANCFDFMQSLPQCDFPRATPTTLSANCQAFLSNAFSYNGCVNMFQSSPDFALNTWRLYGGFTRDLWGDSNDVIRLVDGKGRTVDSISY